MPPGPVYGGHRTVSRLFTTSDDPVIAPFLIHYVSAFVPKSSGEHFNPHVTTGVASREYLDKMLAEPFESFTFSPAGEAVYQLGQLARRRRTEGMGFEALEVAPRLSSGPTAIDLNRRAAFGNSTDRLGLRIQPVDQQI